MLSRRDFLVGTGALAGASVVGIGAVQAMEVPVLTARFTILTSTDFEPFEFAFSHHILPAFESREDAVTSLYSRTIAGGNHIHHYRYGDPFWDLLDHFRLIRNFVSHPTSSVSYDSFIRRPDGTTLLEVVHSVNNSMLESLEHLESVGREFPEFGVDVMVSSQVRFGSYFPVYTGSIIRNKDGLYAVNPDLVRYSRIVRFPARVGA